MIFFYQDIPLGNKVSGNWGIGTNLTNPLQVPVDKVETMKIL